MERGYEFLRSEQESDGSWFGRWGVNHIYGTAAVLPALAALGEDMSQDFVRRAADWLRRSSERGRRLGRDVRVVHGRQRCADAARARRRRPHGRCSRSSRPATAPTSARFGAASRYLVATQRDDGTWDEPYYTGTGFPGYGFGARMDFRDKRTLERIAQGTELQRGFMMNYNLYRHYFPLMALGRARKFLHT